MKSLLLTSFITLSLFAGCIGPKDPKDFDGASLIEMGPGELLLSIRKRSWGGIFGPHGYVGHITTAYFAALDGSGPIFSNPRFEDNPPDFRCMGSITLNREQERVTVNMRRIIISELGKPKLTKPHPANGTYKIESVRPAKPDERQWFRQWQTNRKE